ncbi:hypothetical protein [Nocardia sp. NPDC004860]|uniref:hypothetical protein n=1 Tax=Nocardia sp. NPDC004860 TaxID=3154557 RepID=UPI0033B31450
MTGGSDAEGGEELADYDLLAEIDAGMDFRAARETIQNYDIALAQRIEAFQVLGSLSAQAVHVARPLAPLGITPEKHASLGARVDPDWLQYTSHTHGRIQGNFHSLTNAFEWIGNAYRLTRSLQLAANHVLPNATQRIREAEQAIFNAQSYSDFWTAEQKVTGEVLLTPGGRCVFCTVWVMLNEVSEKFRKAIQPPTFLYVPAFIEPPRHGRIKKGFLARLIEADLAENIDLATDYYVAIHCGSEHDKPLQPWFGEIIKCLKRLAPEDVAHGFEKLTATVHHADRQVVCDTDVVKAYTVLCLNYLRKVQERMSDYAETSGQGRKDPTYAFNFHNSTLNNSPVGSRVESISYSISNVVNQGNQDLGDALDAVKEAILADDLGEEERSGLLDNVEYLAQAAEASPESRKPGMIRSALAALAAAATVGTQLNQALESWGAVLSSIL